LETTRARHRLSLNETVVGFAGFESAASVAYNELDDEYGACQPSSEIRGSKNGHESESSACGRLRTQENRACAFR